MNQLSATSPLQGAELVSHFSRTNATLYKALVHLGALWAHPELEHCRNCWIGIDSPQLYKWNTYSHFVPCTETFKSRLSMQTLLGTWHFLKHHSIMRHHWTLLKSFSQLPYFYPSSKGLLRAVNGKCVIPLKWDGRTPYLSGERSAFGICVSDIQGWLLLPSRQGH